MCFVPQWMMGCVVKAILNLAVGESVLILTKDVCLVCLELISITIVLHSYPIYIYISLWIQTPPEKVLNRPNHTPNTSPEGTWIHRVYIYIYTYYTYHLVM